jgi:hypothetical protein
MESLYVCRFSNGHIKVGRSIDPNSRIATHADRVACMGVSLESSYITECPNLPEARERILIDACVKAGATRFQSEWFDGLDFDQVCKWAYDAAHAFDLPVSSRDTKWSLVIADLRRAGWTHSSLARLLNCGVATVSRLANGQQEEPMHSMGETLLRLQRDGSKPA